MVAHLYFGNFNYLNAASLTKPLLLISLSFFFYFKTRHLGSKSFRNQIQAGLIFSLVGDILLIFNGSSFFIGGLIAFLVGHLLYTGAFLKISGSFNFSWRKVIMMVLVIIYSFTYFFILKNHLGPMTIPVAAYILVISLMLLAAINLYGKVGSKTFWLIFSGAAFFVASDSILACNKFIFSLEDSHFWIMSTYGIAQLLITLGAITQLSKSTYKI